MTANLENSAMATGLEMVSSHSNPKERQCQRMFKLPHSCTHLTLQQGNAQNSPSQASIVMWTVNFQMFRLVLEKAEEPEIKLPTSVGLSKKQESSRKTSISALLTMPKPSTVRITINCRKLWKRWEYQTTFPPSCETCIAAQEAVVRTRQGTMDWFQIRKGVHQGCILSPYLFNLYAEYIMRNAGLDEAKDCWENYQ